MSSDYQTLKKYDGSLYGQIHYNGLEYDWEVPDNLVVGSPGGVSTIHHHYTKGFDGRGNSSGDIFAGQGARYIAGEYGNLYSTGQSATQNSGYFLSAPDYPYWQNETPNANVYDYSYAQSYPIETPLNYGQMYSASPQQHAQFVDNVVNRLHPDWNAKSTKKSKKSIENYSNSELIGSEGLDNSQTLPNTTDLSSILPEIKSELSKVENQQANTITVSPIILFILFLMAFIAFSFWSEAAHRYISAQFHGGNQPSWQRTLMYAIGITLLFIFILYLLNVPLTTFEGV